MVESRCNNMGRLGQQKQKRPGLVLDTGRSALLLPVYMALRPLLPREKRSGGLCWNIFVNCEKFFIWIAGAAAAAVFAENLMLPHDKNLAEVKRAEIKAGSVLGAVAVIILLGLERIVFDSIKEKIEG